MSGWYRINSKLLTDLAGFVVSAPELQRKKQMYVDLLDRQIERGVLVGSGRGSESDPYAFAPTSEAFWSSWEPSEQKRRESVERFVAHAAVLRERHADFYVAAFGS